MMRNIAINGQFTARKMTGQERFAYEVVACLDSLVRTDDNIKLVIPENAVNIPVLQNIEIVRFGKARGSLWEQIFFFYYTYKHDCLSLNLCSIMPVLRPGVICIHDISYKVNPLFFKTVYARVSQVWHKLMFHLAKQFSPVIFTVSEFSKRQMIEVYDYKPEKVVVIPNGWQHFNRIKLLDENLEDKYPQIRGKEFFFSLSSLAPNKNVDWIFKIAQKHPQYEFLIAGNVQKNFAGKDYREMEQNNVTLIGYISDAEIKTLMSKCKAFIFPSFFEGFGIPPLEAMSVGAEIIISKASCLPEIFEKSVHYIDPFDTNISLDEILRSRVADSSKILQKYNYKTAAEIIYSHLIKR